MFTQLELLISSRYLRSKRSEGFISVIAGFSLVGIILGVATLIIVMSVMNGFRAELIGRILGLNGHIGVYEKQNSFQNFDEDSVAIAEIPGVISVSPQIEGQGLLVRNTMSSGVVVRGIRWSDIPARKQLWQSLENKETSDFDDNGIIIGHRLAKKFNIKVNDQVSLLTPQMRVTAFGSVPKQKLFKVIPYKRSSSSFGYSQAVKGTWKQYKEETGNKFATRTRFKDSVDFIGWYTNKTEKILKVSKKDAFKQYIAYHEGWGNFKNYKSNKKVINLANKVQKQSNTYKKQLQNCKNTLSTSRYIVF